MLVNTPHNPTGAVFTREQLELIGTLAAEHDAVVVTDEVYEHMIYDGRPHVPMATLPGMAERTLTISSAGKTFSVTGWKVGWVHGPTELVAAVRAAKQFLTYVSGAPFQPALATALALPDSFYAELAGGLQRKRDLLSDGLRAAGFTVFPHGRHVLRGHRRARARIRRRGGVLLVAAGAGRGGGGAGLGVLRGPRARANAGAVRVLQAGRGADRGGVPVGRGSAGGGIAGMTADALSMILGGIPWRGPRGENVAARKTEVVRMRTDRPDGAMH